MNTKTKFKKKTFFLICGCLLSLQLAGQQIYSDKLSVEAVRKVVNDAVNWQIKAYPDMDKNRIWKSHGDLSWENGVFLSALAIWSEFDNNPTQTEWYENIAQRNKYQLLGGYNRIYFADDLAVALMYAELFSKYKDENIVHPTIARLEFIMNNPSPAGYYMGTPNSKDYWSWSDALYMAPPVFARFSNLWGNYSMLDYMDKEYWKTYHFLYDKEEKLFYRDSSYFNKKEQNGQKVFWGRGNAWVVGGLALTIPEIPLSYPSRADYIKLFREMMERIVSLQSPEGHWHASLLDAASYPSPEMSSTGFFTFALWWGINNNLLDKAVYMPHAEKGWKSLVNAMHPDGMLGWVQPVGADPQKVTYNMTEVYGPGALMLTGKEIIKYIHSTNK